MTTCKECLHVEVCREYVAGLAAARGVELGIKEIETVLESDDCEHFKDRSRFVELPCKPGDMIYRICPINEGEKCCNCPWECCDCYDIGFQSSCRYHSIRVCRAENVEWITKRIPFFGKIYFLTREEAEQALKECESIE